MTWWWQIMWGIWSRRFVPLYGYFSKSMRRSLTLRRYGKLHFPNDQTDDHTNYT